MAISNFNTAPPLHPHSHTHYIHYIYPFVVSLTLHKSWARTKCLTMPTRQMLCLVLRAVSSGDFYGLEPLGRKKNYIIPSKNLKNFKNTTK